jgi:D-3-phosphoglycerate dehydrogenase
MTYRVVFTDHTFDELDIERRVLDGLDVDFVDGEATDAPVDELLAGADAVFVMYESVDAERMDRMPDCRIVSRTGIGLDNVDVNAATERGIAVTNVPDYCIPEVSDHTMALLLALERKVVEYDAQVRDGGWNVGAGRTMHRLDGQVLGLVALGNIAQEVCRKAKAFGMTVRAHDPYLSDEAIRDHGAEPVDDLETLLVESDAVSVHTPLTPETEGLLGAAEFETMQESAFVINAARGGIVDEAALADALADGEIAGAALDVFAEEPPDADDPLVASDRVVLTPHAAWNSAESVVELREKAAQSVRAALTGEVPEYLVNEAALDVE